MSVFLLFVYMSIYIRSSNGFGMNLIKVPDEDRSQVVCTMALLRKYFHSGESLSGSVLSMSITSAPLHIQKNLLQAIHTDTTYPWTVVIKDPHLEVAPSSSALILHEKPQCYFVIVENLEDEDLEDIFEDWKTNVNWNPLAQFVVYLASVEETDEEMTELMIEILLSFMNKKIYNVNVIGQNEENGFYYGKTVFPYHPDNNCGNRVIAIETLDLCNYQESEKDEDDEDYEEDGEEDREENDEVEGEQGDEKETSNENNSKEVDEPNDDKGNNDDNENDDEVANNDSSDDYVHKGKHATGDDSNENEDNENIRNENGDETSNGGDQSQNLQQYAKLQMDSQEHNDSSSNSTNSEEYPRFHLEEIYRALFLDKFPRDLSGCPLVAAYRPWEPYIFNEASEAADDYAENLIFEGSSDDADDSLPEMRLSGIEYKMVQTIGERLHISIDIQVENNNLYHLFQQLIDGDIEMVVGGIDEDPSISQFVSSTIPYHQDDLTWCVAKAKRKHNLFNFLSSFKVNTWMLTLSFIVAASLTIVLQQKFLKLRLGHLQGYFAVAVRIMGVILSQSMHLKYLPTTLKLSLGTAFFMGLMFSNIYQSFLVSTLTTPKSSYQISHLEEIHRYRMTIMGSVENVRHLNKEGEIFKYIREKFQMCYNIEECLNQAAANEHLAVAVSRQHSFYNPRIPRESLYCFDRDENLYVYLVTMLLPKKFHLLHKINPVIQHIIESGHMQKWARDLDMRRKIHEEIQRAREDPLKSLTLAQVGGSFAFSGILLVNAFNTVLIERWVYWMVVRRRTRLKIVKALHRLLR